MKIQLLVTTDCPPCDKAQAVWRAACSALQCELEVLATDAGPGAEIARRLRLKALPAVLIEGELKAVGVQSVEQAKALLGRAMGYDE